MIIIYRIWERWSSLYRSDTIKFNILHFAFNPRRAGRQRRLSLNTRLGDSPAAVATRCVACDGLHCERWASETHVQRTLQTSYTPIRLLYDLVLYKASYLYDMCAITDIALGLKKVDSRTTQRTDSRSFRLGPHLGAQNKLPLDYKFYLNLRSPCASSKNSNSLPAWQISPLLLWWVRVSTDARMLHTSACI